MLCLQNGSTPLEIATNQATKDVFTAFFSKKTGMTSTPTTSPSKPSTCAYCCLYWLSELHTFRMKPVAYAAKSLVVAMYAVFFVGASDCCELILLQFC